MVHAPDGPPRDVPMRQSQRRERPHGSARRLPAGHRAGGEAGEHRDERGGSGGSERRQPVQPSESRIAHVRGRVCLHIPHAESSRTK